MCSSTNLKINACGLLHIMQSIGQKWNTVFLKFDNPQLTSMMIPEFSNYNIKISLKKQKQPNCGAGTTFVISSNDGHKHGQLSIPRKRSSLNLDDEYKYQALLELRDSIHFYEQYELTDDITKYIVNKIRNKTEHQVLESLWKKKSLIIILSEISLVDALRLLCKRCDSIRNKQISNVTFIEALVDTLIQASTFPIAAALFTRCDQWIAIAEKCEQIAELHVEKINSDHVLCLLLYTLTDIQLLSTLSLAIRHIRLKFLHHSCIPGVSENIWSNGNPMMADPLTSGSLFSSDAGGLIQSVCKNSTSFVYSAFDVVLLRCILYTMLLAIINFYATHNECGNVHLRDEPVNSVGEETFEFVMLAVVFALTWQEIIQFTRDSSVFK